MSSTAFATHVTAAAVARPRLGRGGTCVNHNHARTAGAPPTAKRVCHHHVTRALSGVSASAPDEELPPQEWAKEWRASLTPDAIKTFIEASCERLQGVDARFIVIGDGGILESVNEWPSQARFAELGAKGTCCTLASPDKNFEAHLFLAKVQEVALARSERGGRKIYAVRFFGADAAARPMLTVVLHGEEGGEVPQAAVDKWESLAEYL